MEFEDYTEEPEACDNSLGLSDLENVEKRFEELQEAAEGAVDLWKGALKALVIFTTVASYNFASGGDGFISENASIMLGVALAAFIFTSSWALYLHNQTERVKAELEDFYNQEP
jgi:hypothetical protein